jgi:hypothetical protein
MNFGLPNRDLLYFVDHYECDQLLLRGSQDESGNDVEWMGAMR